MTHSYAGLTFGAEENDIRQGYIELSRSTGESFESIADRIETYGEDPRTAAKIRALANDETAAAEEGDGVPEPPVTPTDKGKRGRRGARGAVDSDPRANVDLDGQPDADSEGQLGSVAAGQSASPAMTPDPSVNTTPTVPVSDAVLPPALTTDASDDVTPSTPDNAPAQS